MLEEYQDYDDFINEDIANDILKVLIKINKSKYYIETELSHITNLSLMFNTTPETVYRAFELAVEEGVMMLEMGVFRSTHERSKVAVEQYDKILKSRFIIELDFIERACLNRDKRDLGYIEKQIEATFLAEGSNTVNEQFKFYLSLAKASAHQALQKSYKEMREDIIDTTFVAVFNNAVSNLQRNLMYISLYEAIDDGDAKEALSIVEAYRDKMLEQKVLAISEEV